MVKPPSLTGLMPKLGTQGCRQRGRKRSREAEGGGREGALPTRGGCCPKPSALRLRYAVRIQIVQKSQRQRRMCARIGTHTQAYTHRRTHTHTPAQTHRLTRTRLDTHTDTHFILLFLRFLLFYFTLLLVVFFGFISTYFTLHFSLLPLLLFVFFAFGTPHHPFPAQNKRQLLRRISESLCVNPSH